MSLAAGAVASSSTNMGLDGNENEGSAEKTGNLETETSHQEGGDDSSHKYKRQMSESSMDATDHDDEDDEEGNKIQLGPQCTLKEQLEKDKVCILLLRYTFWFNSIQY